MPESSPRPENQTHLSQPQQTEQNFAQLYAQLEESNAELGVANEELKITIEEVSVVQEELRQQNLELVAEQLKYLDLFNFAPDGYLVTDPSGIIQAANQAVAHQLNVAPEELVGKPLILYVSPANRSLFYEQLHWQFSDPHKKTIEIDFQPRQSNTFPAEVTIAPIFNGTSVVMGLRWLIRDITERRQVETNLADINQQLVISNEELARATRLKDEFLANMSHELRTPLNAILGLSECLQEEIFGPLNDNQKKSIATVERSGQHLLSLINDILDVSKIASGKLELDITEVSIHHLCSSSLAFVKAQASKKQIQLHTHISQDLSIITVDERRMRQVLINLLTNAVKFTPIGGQVTIVIELESLDLDRQLALNSPSLSKPLTQESVDEFFPLQDFILRISVIDTGIGIAATDQAKLFQPFVQLDSSLNRTYEGTGLGLTLVKQIVELHGGYVELESKVGAGSCFTLSLPYCSSLTHGAMHPSTETPSP